MMIDSDPDSVLRPLSTGQIHHVGIVVDDLTEACTELAHRYGSPLVVFPAKKFHCVHRGTTMSPVTQIALTAAGPPHIELLQAVAGTVWMPGPGIHHIAYVVDDLAAGSAALEKRGLPIEVAGLAADGSLSAATYHRDPLGHIVELLAASNARYMAEQISMAEQTSASQARAATAGS
jgi:methylmalonyl-CoA/ethylmalonyl-CoA epimerase